MSTALPAIRTLRGGHLDWWRRDHGRLTARIRAFARGGEFTHAAQDSGRPRITIVTPSYNQGRYLEETILSVLNQAYGNLEYFVVDGGSTDDSVKIIRKYERHLAGWVSEADRGQADAIVKGFGMSTGAILGWINSDDILLPHALDEVARAFETFPGVEFTYGHSLRCDESTLVTDIHFTYPNCYWPAVHRTDNVFQGSVFWSREAYARAGGLDTRLAFAMEYPLIHYLMREEAGAFINAPLAAFRQHADQKTRTIADVGHREVETLFGPTRLPIHWAVRMFAVRMLHLGLSGNLVQKLLIRAAPRPSARNG
jgi:glycosyltransferase involved in cell wall biosynthesis